MNASTSAITDTTNFVFKYASPSDSQGAVYSRPGSYVWDYIKGKLTGSISGLLTSNLTASRVLVSDADGKITVSAVTASELGYLDGVTSAIQTQLDAKAPVTYKTYNSFKTTSDKTEDWYSIFSISDITNTPVICLIRCYAHSSLIFTVSKGYSTHVSLNILDYNSSSNASYAYVKGVRITSDGVVQLLINKGTVNMSVLVLSSNGTTTPASELNVETGTPTVALSRTELLNGRILASGFVGDLSGGASHVKLNLTNPTGGTYYYPIWIGGLSNGSNQAVRGNDGFSYATQEGTTSINGYGNLILGNNKATGTAGNKYGQIALYGKSTYYNNIIPNNTQTSNSDIYLPPGSGTLARISDNVASANQLLKKSNNTITSTTNDTTANWGKENISVHYYTTLNQITSQPSQWGYILNIGDGTSEVHQLWMTQPNGNMLHRGGNASGWNGNWKTLLDSSNYSSYALPLTGGTLYNSGTTAPLKIKSNSGTESWIDFRTNTDTCLGFLGYSGLNNPCVWTNSTARPILHSGNYTNYTVTKTGTGASGTWDISITGSASQLNKTVTMTGSTDANSGKWIKFGRFNLPSAYAGFKGLLAFTAVENPYVYGILQVYIRNTNVVSSTTYALQWLTLSRTPADNIGLVKVSDGVFDIYYKSSATWDTMKITVLAGDGYDYFTMSNGGSYSSSISSVALSSLGGTVGYANSTYSASVLATARTINGTSFDGSANITTANWGTARTISISSTAGTTGTSINGSANASLIIPKNMTGFNRIEISSSDNTVSPVKQNLVLNGVNGNTTTALAPGIGFHIGNVNWGSLKFDNGTFKFFNSDCSGYMPVALGALTATGNITCGNYFSVNPSTNNGGFNYKGRADVGCLCLTNTNWTGYGTSDPESAGYDKVTGRVYFKLI